MKTVVVKIRWKSLVQAQQGVPINKGVKNKMKREEYLEYWRNIASEHKFFGMEISELDNDMLLSVIGFLCEKIEKLECESECMENGGI